MTKIRIERVVNMSCDLRRELVLKRLATVFPDAEVASQALASLDYYGKTPNHPMPGVIHLAILKLCDGKLWRLRDLVKEAKRDFRGVLYPAQAPESFRILPNKKLSEVELAAAQQCDRDQWAAWTSPD